MSANILAAAAAIAAKLETLPDINTAFPYSQPISAMEQGDCILALTGSSPPNTMGPLSDQTIVWSAVVKLGSSLLDVDGGKELQERLARLSSTDPAQGIIGILAFNSADLNEHGYPRVTEDGVEIVYDEETDQDIITLLQCSISANVPIGGMM